MYSLTFCIRVILPERHQWKPAVQAAAVMLRTPPVDGQSPTSQPRPLPIYATQFWERPPTRRRHAQTPPSVHTMSSHDGRKLVTSVRVMLPEQRNPGTDCKAAR